MDVKTQIQAIRDSVSLLGQQNCQVFHAEGGLRGEILKDHDEFDPANAEGYLENQSNAQEADTFFSRLLSTSGNPDDAICNSYIAGGFDFNPVNGDDGERNQSQQLETRGISIIYGDPDQMESLARLIASPITKYLRGFSGKMCARENSYVDLDIALSEWVYIIYEIGSKVGDPNLTRCYRLISPLEKEYLPDSENDVLMGYSDTAPMTMNCFDDERTWELFWDAAKRQELAYSKMGTDLFLASRIALDHLLEMEGLAEFIESTESKLLMHTPEKSVRPSSNISGMTWQQAQDNAIKYVDKNGFLGIEKLIKEVGCSKGTMYKSIKNSRVLKNAKREYDGRRKSALKTLKAVGLSKKTLVKQEQTTEMSPELQAEINSTDKDTMIKYMIKKVPSEKKDEAKEVLKEKSVQEVRDIYKVFLETKDYDTRHKKA